MVRPEDVKSLWVGEQEITPQSTQKVLQKAAGDLGLSQKGSKSQIWKRLVQFQKDDLSRESFVVANKLRKEMNEPNPVVAKDVKQPTEEERRRHEAVHLPFQAWCPYCVSTRSKDNKMLQHDEVEVERKMPRRLHVCVRTRLTRFPR